MNLFQSFFNIILNCGPFFKYCLDALVPFMIVMFTIGIIWGLCSNVLNH